MNPEAARVIQTVAEALMSVTLLGIAFRAGGFFRGQEELIKQVGGLASNMSEYAKKIDTAILDIKELIALHDTKIAVIETTLRLRRVTDAPPNS